MTNATPSPRRVTVVGDALIDELRDEHGSREFVGGAALNVAVGLALLNQDVTLVAMLGDDEPASRIRAYLRDYGVRLVESPSAHGTSRAVSDRTDGEPRYEFNEAAKRRGIRFDDATRGALDEADLVVVSCFPFDDAAQYDALVDAIDRPHERLVVDGNPRAGMLADRDAFLANFEDFASRSLLVKVGDEDAELLLGDSLDAFVERLLSRDPGAVLATAGRDGATLHRAGDRPIHADIVSVARPGRRHDGRGRRHARRGRAAHGRRRGADDEPGLGPDTPRGDGHRGRDGSPRGRPAPDAAPRRGARIPELSDELGPAARTLSAG